MSDRRGSAEEGVASPSATGMFIGDRGHSPSRGRHRRPRRQSEAALRPTRGGREDGRIVVLVSGSGSNMDALIHACEAGEVPGDVVGVIADRGCAALERASARGIETHLIEPARYLSREDWSEALRICVERLDPELVVSAGFMRILAPVFVDAFSGRLINLHPSLLPSFPGAHAVRDALEAGAEESGTTVHFIDNEVDHGPIILQESVPVEPGDDEDALHERIKAVEHRLLPRACKLLLEGKARLEGDRVVVQGS